MKSRGIRFRERIKRFALQAPVLRRFTLSERIVSELYGMLKPFILFEDELIKRSKNKANSLFQIL